MDRLIKLCVVDDIRSVVDMITKKIPWEAHGIEIVGSATNGEEGFAVIRETRPDLILTDIRMPKMDGLEMTRNIMEILPTSKVVILSAYTDFDYAQKAIQYGALDYVKKPFSIDQIVKAVVKAKEVWEQENRSRTQLIGLQQKIKESMPALRQEYLSLLVYHQTNEAELVRLSDFLDINELKPPFAVMTIQIDQFTDKYGEVPVKELELVRFSLQNIVEETIALDGAAVVFREGFNRYICILHVENPERPIAIADQCCANIARHTKFTISIGIGQCVETVQELPKSYQQSLSALSYHFYTGGNGAFSFNSDAQAVPVEWIYTEDSENEFLFAFRSGNRDSCVEWAMTIFNEMGKVSVLPEPGVVERLLQGLVLRMLRVLMEKFPRPSLAEFEAKTLEIRDSEAAILAYRAWFIELCEIGCGLIHQERASESQKIIHRSADYIKANLDIDLTLEHCAKQVNLSWGYYSNLFKKVTGSTFGQFVTQAKMERAKSMLIEDYQVQEIAQQLGYEHRRYFSEVFKKQTGLTPTEFKEMSLGKSSKP
ncbi:AraC family transcriptional regulator [Paenibacillus sp. Soil766]|uniref:response regulator n=1 Tax=Paenibacillus sp. Soil766 TaxID=1736404 RepID=UPI00070BAA7D|nr:response regulator [Paenibacillus sp. Soil766]KRE83966.1 AraC family transcriptional regulator [Paenibacillus sp. Soil766]